MGVDEEEEEEVRAHVMWEALGKSGGATKEIENCTLLCVCM